MTMQQDNRSPTNLTNTTSASSTMSDSLYRGGFTVAREEHYWVATHNDTGIASHGEDPNDAIDQAIEAVELAKSDPEPASEEKQDEIRREFGIDVDDDERGIESPNGMP